MFNVTLRPLYGKCGTATLVFIAVPYRSILLVGEIMPRDSTGHLPFAKLNCLAVPGITDYGTRLLQVLLAYQIKFLTGKKENAV